MSLHPISNPNGNFTVGNGRLDSSGGVFVWGSSPLEVGSSVPGKFSKAGQLLYNPSSVPPVVELYGGGSQLSDLKLKFYGNMQVTGSLSVDGGIVGGTTAGPAPPPQYDVIPVSMSSGFTEWQSGGVTSVCLEDGNPAGGYAFTAGSGSFLDLANDGTNTIGGTWSTACITHRGVTLAGSSVCTTRMVVVYRLQGSSTWVDLSTEFNVVDRSQSKGYVSSASPWFTFPSPVAPVGTGIELGLKINGVVSAGSAISTAYRANGITLLVRSRA